MIPSYYYENAPEHIKKLIEKRNHALRLLDAKENARPELREKRVEKVLQPSKDNVAPFIGEERIIQQEVASGKKKIYPQLQIRFKKELYDFIAHNPEGIHPNEFIRVLVRRYKHARDKIENSGLDLPEDNTSNILLQDDKDALYSE